MITVPIPPGSYIDPYLMEHRTGAVFELSEGEYTTRGASVFPDWCSLGPECRIDGAGSERTHLRLVPPAASSDGKAAPYYEILTTGSRSGISRHVAVRGLHIDALALRPAVGLHIWSADASVYDVRVTGVWGEAKPSAPWEGFGILVNRSGAADTHDGGASVRMCSVTFAPRPPTPTSATTRNYATGIYVGMEARLGTPIMESRVEACRVMACSQSYVPDVGFGINSCTVIANSQAWGVERGVFSDTGDGRDSRIEHCRLVAGYAGIDFKASDPTWARVNVRIRDCDITLCGTATADHVAGLVLSDQSKARNQSVFNRVIVEGSRITNASVGTAYRGSINAARAEANGFRSCDWIGSWKPAVVADGVPKAGWLPE